MVCSCAHCFCLLNHYVHLWGLILSSEFSDAEVAGDWRNYYTNEKAVLNLGQETTTSPVYNCGVQAGFIVG